MKHIVFAIVLTAIISAAFAAIMSMPSCRAAGEPGVVTVIDKGHHEAVDGRPAQWFLFVDDGSYKFFVTCRESSFNAIAIGDRVEIKAVVIGRIETRRLAIEDD